MKIIIETKPYNEMRYPTLGDYEYGEDGILNITVADTGNDDFNWCIALHEFIEEKMTRKHGIKEGDITKFDLWVEEEIKKGNYPDDAEPGDHPFCIYKKEHQFSENIERLCAYELEMKWNDNNEIKKPLK